MKKPFQQSVVWMTILFLFIIAFVPFLIDLFGRLFFALGAQRATAFFVSNLWLEGVLSYLPIYLIMLFYLKTTFLPLSSFGYKWNSRYAWWAVYLGIGSGFIIYFIDVVSKNTQIDIQAFSIAGLLGYTLSWVLLPALTEETLFRGVVQNYYMQCTKITLFHGISVAVLIGSVAELLFHLSVPVYIGITGSGVASAFFSTLPQLIYVAIFGFIGGIFYQRTGSLTCPIIIHALGNFTELALLWMF